jgi:signal transduction histidine kinase
VTGSDILNFDKLNREINRGYCMKQNRDLILRVLSGKLFSKSGSDGEEEKREIAIRAIQKVMASIAYYIVDPLTVVQAKAELLEESLKKKDLNGEEIESFISLCKEQFRKINLILNALSSLSELRYRKYPLGIEIIDIEDKIKKDLRSKLVLRKTD